MVILVDGCSPAADARVKAGGTARRRRHQTKRADARHVDWLLSLQQSKCAHHTAPLGQCGFVEGTLEARILALESALALLVCGGAQQAGEPTVNQADARTSVAHDAEPGEVHLIALQAEAAVATAPGEVQLIALQAFAVERLADDNVELHRVAAEQAFAEAAVAEARALSTQRAAAEHLRAGQLATLAAMEVLEHVEEAAASVMQLEAVQRVVAPPALAEDDWSSEAAAGAHSFSVCAASEVGLSCAVMVGDLPPSRNVEEQLWLTLGTYGLVKNVYYGRNWREAIVVFATCEDAACARDILNDVFFLESCLRPVTLRSVSGSEVNVWWRRQQFSKGWRR